MGAQQSVYSRLDPKAREIRLVHIQPGLWDDPILCEIEIVSLNSSPCPVYQTLSYTWGDSQATKPILLEDCLIDVKANLWAALRRLRCADKTRVIWIDALCINQTNIQEKNLQVMLMGKIYSSCREVIM
jgi:Heterokaryon incompatibility protein (HET)